MGPARWLVAAAVVAFLIGLLWWGTAINEDTPVAERPVGTAPQNGTTDGNTSR